VELNSIEVYIPKNDFGLSHAELKKANQTLSEIVGNEEESSANRIRAAKAIQDFAIKLAHEVRCEKMLVFSMIKNGIDLDQFDAPESLDEVELV